MLYYYKQSVRPFKIGPDFIDPQFHEKICKTPSINLDINICKEKGVKWLFSNYSDKQISILEGVMGFYDGMDKSSSAYNVTTLLDIPTVIILDASGSYITLSAVLKGLKEYKKDNTIKAVVFNHISSKGHYELIKTQIEKDFDDVVCLGWIKSKLDTLDSTHLGLDLKDCDLNKIESLSKEVLENVDVEKLEKITEHTKEKITYPFEEVEKQNKHLVIVYDKNFSFLYHDNLQFFKEYFSKVTVVDSTKDEVIPKDADSVFICGGYIETPKAYNRYKNSLNFQKSLKEHAKTKKVYGECAGLILLGKSCDDKKMLGLLPLEFELNSRFVRMGYYSNDLGITGHSFHYTSIKEIKNEEFTLYKKKNQNETYGAFKKRDIFGTYLHTMFRANFSKVKNYLV